MPKRSRDEYTEDPSKRFKTLELCQKRKYEGDYEPRKRQKNWEDCVNKLKGENDMMRQACFEAGGTIESLRKRVTHLEMLLNLQRGQMERFRINNDISVY
jgi:hypothetical protein